MKPLIDAGQPVPLGLPARPGAVSPAIFIPFSPELAGVLGVERLVRSHQVIAIGYQEANGIREVVVYDPNYPNIPMLLRIEADDRVVEFAPDPNASNGTLKASSQVGTWNGLFLADGFTPQAPPPGLEDLVVTTGLRAPANVSITTTFTVDFTVANVGEFDTPLAELCLLIDGAVLNTPGNVPGERLALGQQFTGSFQVQLGNAGWHTLELKARRQPNDLLTPFAPRATRQILVSQGFAAGSYVQLASIPPGPLASPVLGAQLTGPSLATPGAPESYEITQWNLRIRALMREQLGGGTFVEPVKKATWKLDHLPFTSVSQGKALRSADLHASYAPDKTRKSTVLRVTIEDAAGATFTASIALPCHEVQRHIPRLPDLEHLFDPGFGRAPAIPLPPRPPRRDVGPG